MNNRISMIGGMKVVLTKLTRPRLPLTYQRTDLYNLLDELSATPLIVVRGLLGSGKTTLISSYIESRNIPCLWYQLDRNDKDLDTFFYYLGIAALRVNSYNKTALPQVSTEQIFNTSFQTKEYFQRLYQCLETPFMIVLDNYQELPKDAALHEAIGAACAALPPGARIVLIDDSDYRTQLPKPHSHRAIATLDSEELKLSPRDVKEIAALYGVRLPSDQAAKQLHVKVGGWVAGLVQELKGECLPQNNLSRLAGALDR